MKTFEEQINELAAPVQQVIKEAFETKLNEARETIYAQARKEINEKYKADFEALVKGSEAFIKESIEEECDDLNKEKEELKEKSEKCDESLVKFQKMIAEQLAKEVVGIRKERAQLSEKLASFDINTIVSYRDVTSLTVSVRAKGNSNCVTSAQSSREWAVITH